MSSKRSKKKGKKIKKLPRRLLFIPSSDKNFVESWSQSRDPLDIPGMRIILCGRPGCGKTCMIKNILLRTQQSRKPYERIFVLHQDPYAKEYDDIGAEVITQLPENDFWMGYDEDDFDPEEPPERPKTLVIIDDICFKDMDKSQTLLLDRLAGFNSTHLNISLACLNQDVFAIDPIIRKCCNVWCIWRPSDNDQLNVIGRRCGFRSKDFRELFDEVATKDSDSIMIDKTTNSPYPIRLNGYTLVELQ